MTDAITLMIINITIVTRQDAVVGMGDMDIPSVQQMVLLTFPERKVSPAEGLSFN